jgi:hypothetical protein
MTDENFPCTEQPIGVKNTERGGAVLRIRDVYPGSEFFHLRSRIRIKEFTLILTQKIVSVLSEK